MDVEIDTTSAAAASSGDGGETKSDGSPKPVTTESLKSSSSSQLENGNDGSSNQKASANSLSPEKMDVTSEKSLSPPVLTKEMDSNEQNGGNKRNQEMKNKDSKDNKMEVDSQDSEQKMEEDDTDCEKICQPPSLDNFDKGKDSSPSSNAPTLDKTDDNDDSASVSSKIDSKEETKSNHEEEKVESEKKEKDETNKEVKSESGQKKVSEEKESESQSKDETTIEKKEKKLSENDADNKKEDGNDDDDDDDDDSENVKKDGEKKEIDEKTKDEKTTKNSEDEAKEKKEKSETDAKDEKSKSEKPEIGRISPRRTRSQNKTKPSVATYLEDDFDDEDDLDLQITAVSGAVDGQLTGKSRSGKSDSKGQGSKSSKSIQKCIVCHKVGKCKYNIVRNGDIKHLCDDECFRQFRVNPTVYLRTTSPSSTSTPVPTPTTMTSHMEPAPAPAHYKTCSVCQLMNINTNKHFLNWQGLDFCGEECLGKFQSSLGGTCSFCGSQVPPSAKAKYCLKLGTEIKQFCGTQCHAQFKKRLKVCSYCQKDLTNVSDSFMAPVGWEQGVFKDFCSQSCLQKYEEKNNKDVEIIGVEQSKKNQPCAVCGKVWVVKHEIKFEGKVHKMCSDPCFSAFQYANKLTMNTCDNCGVYCYNEGMQPQYIQFEGNQKRFCSYMCVNTFRALNKKVVSCAWCGSKKSNFDMIERVDANNKYQLFCSLNCLSLYRVNLQATSNQAVTCDQCRKFVPAQYHLTMSDASVRNFCSYNCVMGFQSQFSSPSSGGASGTSSLQSKSQSAVQISTSKSSRPATRSGQRQQSVSLKPTTQVPVIITSQAQTQKSSSLGITSISSSNSTPMSVSTGTSMGASSSSSSSSSNIGNQVIIQPPPPKSVKNKSLLCKPFVQTKATSCRPHTQSKEVQTDGEAEAKTIFVPVPVPIYVPLPMPMYNTVTPFPFAVPLPVPIPCFIPTTKKSSASILKHIKEIQEKIPADPFEAELLMMAEAVANAEQSSSEEDEEIDQPSNETDDDKLTNTSQVSTVATAAAAAAPTPQCENSTAQNTVTNCSKDFDDEVLQMSLNITAAEISEPSLDLESFLEFNPPLGSSNSTSDLKNRTDLKSKQVGRGGNKRAAVTGARGGRRNKRIRVVEDESPLLEGEGDNADGQHVSPDSNMHLKYTYGVYAWRQWVVQKNAQLEKVSKSGPGRLKLFKTDLLQCTPDELNYSLCLFVKEVRKPNKEEYSPDSIHYLCLGIQQYLFENGRIDNIFTDMYYEKFTECLNEILMRYEPRVNGLGQLVCRIEEEHLWECKQLGAHSPHVLLNTLIYFNTKHFLLKNPEDHIKLSFTHIMKHWKKGTPGKGGSGRCVYLRYYCNADAINQKKRREELPVYEQCENFENPLRCPVKLYEFYLSKCPESIKNRNDVFYLIPERSCVPDSPVWYSTQSLSSDLMTKMLNRIRLVKEIQEAAMNTQPVYV